MYILDSIDKNFALLFLLLSSTSSMSIELMNIYEVILFNKTFMRKKKKHSYDLFKV